MEELPCMLSLLTRLEPISVSHNLLSFSYSAPGGQSKGTKTIVSTL